MTSSTLSPINCATGLALFILTVCAVRGVLVEDKLFANVGLDDVTFTGNLLFTTNSVRSVFECARLCLRDAACKSFTHSPSVKGCMAYSVSLNASSPSLPAPTPCSTYTVNLNLNIPNNMHSCPANQVWNQTLLTCVSTPCIPGAMWADPADCSFFFQCQAWSEAVRMPCGVGLVFDNDGLFCDWPANVNCTVP